MGLFLNEERFITEGMSLVQYNFLGETYEEYCDNVAQFNQDINEQLSVLSESNEQLNEETQQLNQQLLEMCEPGENAQDIQEVVPIAVGLGLGARALGGWAMRKFGKKGI